MKISNAWSRTALIAVVAAGGIACRNTPSDPDVQNPTDAQGDMARPDTNIGPDVEHTDATAEGGGMDGSIVRMVTIRQVQDIADLMHPAQGSNVTINQTGMVALTTRWLIGNASGDSSGRCRFAVWVGDGTGGDFSGIQVQEIIQLGDAGNCFSTTARNIPADIAPGSPVSLIDTANYSEFCSGPTGIDRTMCRNFEQANLFGPRMVTTGAPGTPPAPSVVAFNELAQNTDGSPGSRTLALEGVLVRVNNVRLRSQAMTTDAGAMFTQYSAYDSADTGMTRPIGIQIENFVTTRCVRDYITANTGMTAASITGILVPNFGVWSIRIRDEHDIAGIDCTARDGGLTDAATGG